MAEAEFGFVADDEDQSGEFGFVPDSSVVGLEAPDRPAPVRAAVASGEVIPQDRDIWSTGVDLLRGDQATPYPDEALPNLGGTQFLASEQNLVRQDSGVTPNPAAGVKFPPPSGQEDAASFVNSAEAADEETMQAHELESFQKQLNPLEDQSGNPVIGAVGSAYGALANQAAGVIDFLEPDQVISETAGNPANQHRLDAVRQRLTDTAAQRDTPQYQELLNEARELSRPMRENTFAGKLARSAANAREEAATVPGAAGSISRGVGSVAAYVPSMVTGSTIGGLAVGSAQALTEAESTARTAMADNLRAGGVTDEAEIYDSAKEAGNEAAAKAALTMPFYLLSGRLAAAAAGKLLPNATRFKTVAAQTIAATTANVGAGALIRTLEGGEAMPNLEQFTMDALWGVIHGVGVNASEKAKSRARGELASRGWAQHEIDNPSGMPERFRAGEEQPASGITISPDLLPPAKAAETLPVKKATPVTPESIAAANGAKYDGVTKFPGNPHQFTDQRTGSTFIVLGDVTPEKVQAKVDKIDESYGLEPRERQLGPGAANIEEPIVNREPVGAWNAKVDEQRVARGLEPLASEARKADEVTWADAEKRIEENPRYASDLVDALNEGKKESVSDTEQTALLREMIDLRNKRDQATERAFDEQTYSPEERAAFLEEAKTTEERLQRTEEADRLAGTAQGRALRIRRLMAYEDFTLAGLMGKARRAKGEDLTPAEATTLKTKADRFKKAKEKFEERAEEAEAGQPVDEAIRQIEAEASKDPEFTPEVRSLADRIVSRLERAGNAARSRLRGLMSQLGSGADITKGAAIVKEFSIVAASDIARGVVKFGQWATKMVKEFGEKVKPYLADAWKQADANIDAQVAGSRTKKPKEVKAAVTKENASARVEQIAGEMKAKGGALSTMRGDIQKLVETLVRGGIKTRAPLVDAVHEVLKGVDPAITRRQTMDAISGYGDFKQLNKDAVKAEVRDLKQQLQLVAKIEDVEAKVPLAKSGMERQKLSDESRRLTKELNEALKKHGVVVTDPAKQLQTMLAATETRLTNRIKDLRDEITAGEERVKIKTDRPTSDKIEALRKELSAVEAEHKSLFEEPPISDAQKALDKALVERERLDQALAGEIAPSKKQSKEALSELENDVRAEIAAMRELAAEVRRAEKPKADPEVAKENAQVKALEKTAAEYERRLNEADFSTTGKRQGPDTARVAQARALRDAARAALETARKLTKPVRTKEQIALQNYKTMVARKVAELESRIIKGDFGPRPKRIPMDLSKDPEAVKAKAEMDRVKKEFSEKQTQWQRANRSVIRKVWDGIKETLATSRSLITSADVSAPFRQGGFLLLGDLVFHPVRAAKQLGTMFRQLVSEKGFERAQAAIMLRPNAKLYDQSKLYLADMSGKLSGREESMRSNLAEKIPLVKYVVRASNRAYAGFLNRQRADSFDAMVESFGGSAKVTPAEAKAIAEFVNTATGRGTVGGMERSADALARYFFSPRFLASRFQLVAGQPLVGAARKAVAQQYAKFALGLAAVYGLALLNGGTVEHDPRSPDFGKAKFGDTRIDPLSGMAQVTTFVARMTTGKTKSGDTVKKQKRSDTFTRFARTKLAPIPGVAADFAAEKTLDFKEPTVAGSVQRLTVPISYQDAPGVYKEHGMLRGTIMEALNLMGMGVQKYSR